MKHYKLDGLNYYVSAVSKEMASVVCIKNHWGVMPSNLIEVERIPDDAEKVISQF